MRWRGSSDQPPGGGYSLPTHHLPPKAGRGGGGEDAKFPLLVAKGTFRLEPGTKQHLHLGSCRRLASEVPERYVTLEDEAHIVLHRTGITLVGDRWCDGHQVMEFSLVNLADQSVTYVTRMNAYRPGHFPVNGSVMRASGEGSDDVRLEIIDRGPRAERPSTLCRQYTIFQGAVLFDLFQTYGEVTRENIESFVTRDRYGIMGIRGSPIAHYIGKNSESPYLKDKITIDRSGGRIAVREDAWVYIRNQLVESVINVMTRTPTRTLYLHTTLGGESLDDVSKMTVHEVYEPDTPAAQAFWVEVEVWYYLDPTTNGHHHHQ